MNLVWRGAALLAVGLGLVGLFALVDKWVTSRSYDDWQSTRGKVSYSELVSGIGCGPGVTMSSMVIYDYRVAGVPYSSFTISNGMDGVSCGTDGVENYPLGTEVTVYYDPDNPRDAVLKRTELNTWWGIFIGFMLLGMIGFGVVGWRCLP